jgi:hypothetical protein
MAALTLTGIGLPMASVDKGNLTQTQLPKTNTQYDKINGFTMWIFNTIAYQFDGRISKKND